MSKQTFKEQFGDVYGKIIESKYAYTDREGVLLENSYEDIVNRHVDTAAKYRKIFKEDIFLAQLYDALINMRIIPGGSIIASIGTGNLTSLSNCFVVPAVEDSYEDIIRKDAMLAHIMKRRGGVGLDLSNIRPKGSLVNNAAKTSTGIVPFMHRYSNTTLEVAQGGRRGALMLSIDYKHKDVLDFINAKTDKTSIKGANISVKADGDLFLKENEKILNSIIKNMYGYAEPGLLFWDNILDNPIDAMSHPMFMTSSTNPCGEIPLNPYGTCILAHQNLYAYVTDPFTPKAALDLTLLKQDAAVLTMFMNIVVEEELKHIRRILAKSQQGVEHNLWLEVDRVLRQGRRIGIGKTGLADMLAALNLTYEPHGVIEQVSKTILDTVYMTSCTIETKAPVLNVKRNFKKFRAHKLIKGIYERNKIDEDLVPANIGFTTLAPVGTGSIIADVSSGMEPVFALEYKRKRRANEFEEASIIDESGDKWIEFGVFHKQYDVWAKTNRVKEIHKDKIGTGSPYLGQTSDKINVRDKIAIQAILQKYTDQSISVTHNVPKQFPMEDIRELIEEAHAVGIKGFTLYRDGSREGILTTEPQSVSAAQTGRPKALKCDIHNVKIDGKVWNVLIGIKDGRPYEIFALMVNNIVIKNIESAYLIKEKVKNKTTYSLQSEFIDIKDITSYYTSGNEQVLTRLLSRSLQRGESVEKLVSDFDKVSMTIGTFEQVLRRVLSRYVDAFFLREMCPECNSEMIVEGGCKTCKNCGISKCE
jgi:ribonucleoside-diphosphate reductase alpha chain